MTQFFSKKLGAPQVDARLLVPSYGQSYTTKADWALAPRFIYTTPIADMSNASLYGSP